MQKKIALIITIFVLSILLGTTSAGNFFVGDINMIDEGQFAAWANHMLHGEHMYKDMYIVYGPLFVYPVYLLYKFFTPTAFLLRLYLILGSAIGVIGAYYVMEQLNITKFLRFVLLALLLLIPTMQLRQGLGLWTLYFLMASYSKKSGLWSYVSGFLAAITFLVSQDVGIFILIVAFAHYAYQYLSSNKVTSVLIQNTFFVLGFLTVWTTFFIWASYEGWFWDYVRVTKDVSISLAGINVPNGKNFPNPFEIINTKDYLSAIKSMLSKEMLLYASLIVYFASIFYLTVTLFLRRLSGVRYNFFLLTIFGLLIYSILLSRSGIGHFFYTLPPIIIIGGYFVSELVVVRKKHKHLSTVLILVISMYFARLLYLNNPQFKTLLNFSTYVSADYNNPPRVGTLNISNGQKNKISSIQRFVNTSTKASDYVFFFNDQPMMYMLVDRLNPTDYDLPFAGNTLEKRIRMLNSIASKKPKYIFIDREVWAIDEIPNSQRLPEVISYIKSNYYLYSEIDKVLVYKIKDPKANLPKI